MTVRSNTTSVRVALRDKAPRRPLTFDVKIIRETFMKHYGYSVVAIIVLSMAGCATNSFTKPMAQGGNFDKAKSYVYGRFEITGIHPIDISLNGYSSIGLKFNCQGGNIFVIGLSPVDPDQIIEVPPGHCSLDTLLFTDGARGRINSEKPFSGQVLKNVVFEPGKAHYVGDFTGKFEMHSWGSTTQLTDIRNNFQTTSAAVSSKSPQFASLQMVNVIKTAK